MKLEHLMAMAARGVAYDTETYAMTPGVKIPKLVCASVGYLAGDQIEGQILDKDQAAQLFAEILASPETVVAGANITFDLSVMALHAMRKGVDIMPEIFKALDDQRVYDLLLAEALNAIAEGHHAIDPRSGGTLRNSEGQATKRYNLFNVVDLVLGRVDAKANDEWRVRYGELDGIPIEQWPQTARDYPVDDARNTMECALAQTGHLYKLVAGHEFDDSTPVPKCKHCGATTWGGMCRIKARHRNLHDLGNQVGTQFQLHMGGSWGFRINQKTVDAVEAEALRGRIGADIPFKELGILREDGSQDLARTKTLVAEAYGAKDPCPTCSGSGKIMSPKAKVIRCRGCKGACVAEKNTPAVLKWKLGHPAGCAECQNKGSYQDPKQLVVCFAGTEPDPEDPSKERKIKTCDGTGYILTEDVPRSEKEGVGYGRDVLNESGDDRLVAFAAWDADKKDLQVYVPFFRRARMPVAGHAPECPHLPSKLKEVCTCHALGCPSQRVENPEQCTCQQRGFFKDIPLTLSANTIVETGRVSYDGIIQTLKRSSGYFNDDGVYVPSLRECFEARGPRYEIVEVPDDYVLQPGELAA